MGAPLYTPTEIDAVMERYASTPTAELAAEIGSSIGRLWRLARLLDIRKDVTVVAAMAKERSSDPNHPMRRYQFQKGIVPHNKGKKMPGFATGRMRETQFKKGNVNHNIMPIGSTRVIDGYLYRKISAIPYQPYTVNWKAVHILKWEKLRGPVPPSHAVVFKDGNRRNFRIGNLECISRADLARRNSIHNLPEPLKEVIRLKGAIKRVITCKRRNDAKKQDVRPA